MSNGEMGKIVAILPYINKRVTGKVKNIIVKSGLAMRVSFKYKKFYQLLKSQMEKEETEKLGMRGVVYKISCRLCREKGIVKCYVGETGRALRIRYKKGSV
jgi:hypothetical protein